MIKASAVVSPQPQVSEERIPAVVHLDLDGGSHIYRIHGWSYEAQDDPLFETGLQQALKFFDKFKVRATLFVIAEDLNNPCKSELIQEAMRQGHGIASHSFTHRRLTTLNRDEKYREIFESRERIATRLGVEVQGFRAPYFEIDRETLELVAAAGYTYDSSLFLNSRFIQKIEATGLKESPYYTIENSPLREMPLPSYGPLPLPFHPCYSLVLGTWYFHLGLRRFRQTHAPFILLFHLTDFADPLPTHFLCNWKTKLFTLSYLNGAYKRKRCEEILEIVGRNYTLIDRINSL
jgi:hypothetical protein